MMMLMRNNEEVKLERAKVVKPVSSTPTFWPGLSRVGLRHMKQMAPVIDEIAPKPGSLVYITARELQVHQGDLAPVVFSAVDVCTHLQVAQLYMTLTFASAIDFLDFVREKFPFPVVHVQTPVQVPFFDLSANERRHEFAQVVTQRGILHTAIVDPSREELFITLSKLMFGGTLVNAPNPPSERELVRDLVNFLFFHNNHRALPSLAGRTPLQKLKTFPQFQYLHSYDPLSPVTRWK